MRPRTLLHLSWWFAALVLIAVTGLAEQVIAHAWLGALAAIGAVVLAYSAGRHHGRDGGRKASRRRLEDAQRAGQVAELEQLVGRSLDEIVSSYRLVTRQHGGDCR